LTRATDREPSPASVADAEKYVGKKFWIKHERVCPTVDMVAALAACLQRTAGFTVARWDTDKKEGEVRHRIIFDDGSTGYVDAYH
jgi:hypothetical protein